MLVRLLPPLTYRSCKYLPALSVMPKRSRSDVIANAGQDETKTVEKKPKKKTAAPLRPSVDIEDLKPKAEKIVAALNSHFPPPVPIPLNHGTSFQLLVAVVLSAQVCMHVLRACYFVAHVSGMHRTCPANAQSCMLVAYHMLWCLACLFANVQSTDAKVNTVTPELFSLYPDAQTMAKAPVRKMC